MRQPSFNPHLGACRTLGEDALHHCISEHHCCTVAQTGKEDSERGKMLYFEIILCDDYMGLVSVTWENVAPVAGVRGGCSAPRSLFVPPLQGPVLL